MFIRNTTKGEWMVNLVLGYEAEEKRIALFEILLPSIVFQPICMLANLNIK
jgi:hypothetical protein